MAEIPVTVVYPEPFIAWLRANGVKPSMTPEWPRLEIDEPAGVFRIEQYWYQPEPGPDGAAVMQVIGDLEGRVMREFPLVEAMGAELASAWALMSERGHRQQVIRDFAAQMRGHRISTVVVTDGDRLLLVVPGVDVERQKAFAASLGEVLPGVPVSFATGVSAVVTITGGTDGAVEAVGTEVTVAARRRSTHIAA